MCELFGMSFNLPVSPTFTFRGFTKRGKCNPDGWGIALYPGGGKAAQIIKEPVNADDSSLAEYIIKVPEFYSKIYISHVRLKSRGESAYWNTHPFSRELNGRDYCFAHNGTLRESYGRDLMLGTLNPIGGTDSEYAFCHLMSFIENNIESWNESSFSLLYDKFQEINAYGDFNCLFSDGEYLFCYHDAGGYTGLCYVRRTAPYTKVKLTDEDFEIDLQGEKRPEQAGYIIATRPLTDENWVRFTPGELIVFKNGDISHIRGQIDNIELKVLKAIRTAPHKMQIGQLATILELSESDASKCIESLTSKGYIQQDSRDTVDLMDKKASYYTVRAKRDKIDRLIEDISD
jgi:predicted glutamine amidotransferase